jgi:hypothetical protein
LKPGQSQRPHSHADADSNQDNATGLAH